MLQRHELPCQWDNQDISMPILVSLDKHMPIRRDVDDNDQEDDHLEVALYLPQNKETEDYCWNDSYEEDGEPADSWYFYQKIDDRESLKDALMKVEPKIRKYITHYQRCTTIDDCIIPQNQSYLFMTDTTLGERESLRGIGRKRYRDGAPINYN